MIYIYIAITDPFILIAAIPTGVLLYFTTIYILTSRKNPRSQSLTWIHFFDMNIGGPGSNINDVQARLILKSYYDFFKEN